MIEQPASKKILLVDDEEATLSFLARSLTRAGYAVSTAGDGRSALDAVHSEQPDLIVLDICLPDMRGEEVKQQLTENKTTQDIPVIFVTGILNKDEQHIFEKLAGKIYALAKPVDIEELLSTIESVFLDTAQ